MGKEQQVPSSDFNGAGKLQSDPLLLEHPPEPIDEDAPFPTESFIDYLERMARKAEQKGINK